ncbi:GIY-YIG nuclease family protein [Colwellia hornerae]|uniref:GIY-YIG nuclease family protein n=1 Tax=Colwellia hornerae TaxID=89402 RepID=A0A5C6Q7G6_9GAMM|nr:GIY-YIG nuclease family protein [Colwellia hornerae]TWX49229.1 GIY-YIG nuclease family protein [Colwellia hornerae]TWX55821.1 GIY-YIG nuclease family protein [Colwellia hornerae]TWX64691.1 GIY-YIG nuclease family protein [Colwellia hornerae]
MSLKNVPPANPLDNISFGNVYIMTHSIFSNVIRIGCTSNDTEEYAKSLSKKSPGHYQLFFSLACENPCKVKNQIRQYFEAKRYVNEFYEVSPEIASNILKREVLKIPVVSIH